MSQQLDKRLSSVDWTILGLDFFELIINLNLYSLKYLWVEFTRVLKAHFNNLNLKFSNRKFQFLSNSKWLELWMSKEEKKIDNYLSN